MHTITKSEGNAEVIDVKWLLARDEDFPSYPRAHHRHRRSHQPLRVGDYRIATTLSGGGRWSAGGALAASAAESQYHQAASSVIPRTDMSDNGKRGEEGLGTGVVVKAPPKTKTKVDVQGTDVE